jgi:hypothetical protein
MFPSAPRASPAFAALALAAPLIAAGAAEAQVRSDVKQYYWQSYEAPNQQRQYREYRDSVAPSYACSEQRYTSQACWTDESGEQRCQTATGRSAQSCQ